MSIHTFLRICAVGLVAMIALDSTTAPVTPRAAHAAVPSPTARSAFSWPGVYDLVGNGFPDGERKAVMHIARTDTSYAIVSLQGPPGSLVRFHVVGDSAHVMWNLGTDVMVVDLRGAGDSLIGVWETDEWSGTVRGVRRR